MGIERVRYRGMVYPGDVVEIEARVKRLRSKMGVLQGRARVGNRLIAHGTMTFALGGPTAGAAVNRLPRLATIANEDAGWGFFLCAFKEVRTGRNGGEFLFLALQDSSGQVPAKLFTDIDRFRTEVEAGDFVRVEGKATLYNGHVQLVLSTLRRVNPDQDKLQGFREEDCVLSAPRPADEMWAELMGHLGSVRDPHLRVLLNRIVLDNEAQLRDLAGGAADPSRVPRRIPRAHHEDGRGWTVPGPGVRRQRRPGPGGCDPP